MTASELLSQLRETGVAVKTSGEDRLVIDAPKGSITSELRNALTVHKAELLQILKAEQTVAPAVKAAAPEVKLSAPEVPPTPPAPAKPVTEEDSAAALADAEIKQLEGELLRLRTEEEGRRGEFEANRLAAENALRAEHERRREAEEQKARERAEQEKQRIAAEAREHAAEESRRQIAEQEIARAEEEVKRMRAMEESRRSEVEAGFRAAAEARRAEMEARRQTEEHEARVRGEEERQLMDAEARKRAQEDELRRHAESRFQAVEVEIARVRAREEARLKSAEEARALAAQAERRRAEEEARRQAEATALRRAEEEARLRAEIETQMRAEAEARRQAEEEARARAEEEARRRAEDEARRLAAAEAQRRAEEQAHRQAEAEARLQAEAAERSRAEEEARRRSEAEARRRAEEEERLRAADAVRQRAEMEARIRAEVEAKLRAEDEARRQAEAARNQTEQSADYPLEIERSGNDQAPQPKSGEVAPKEIVEWFDVEFERQPDAHASPDSSAAMTPDESAGEFHAVSVPEAEATPSPIPAAIVHQLSSNKPAERAAAIDDLAKFGGEDAFQHISAAFDDQSIEVRSAAARALFELQGDRAAAYTRALREATPERRRKIGAAIASSGLANEAIRNLTGESRDKTYDAFSLLFLMSKAGEVQPLMRAIEDHPNIEVRLAVVKLLALSGQADVLPAFRRMAVRGSLPPEVRSAVMEAIYQITSQSPADEASIV